MANNQVKILKTPNTNITKRKKALEINEVANYKGHPFKVIEQAIIDASKLHLSLNFFKSK